jgi:NAD(P)-dependent dehydrogenase (short-subunit alcohol dehydrogenase family)
VLTATDVEHLGAVVDACDAGGAEAVPLALDLADVPAAAESARSAAATLGRVDALVNSAGVLGERIPLADYPVDAFRRVLEIDLVGVLAVTQAIAPWMSDGGVIVNVSSGAVGRPGWGAYAIAKTGLEAMSAMLRVELSASGVRVVALDPGGMRTEMRAAAYPQEDPATLPHPSTKTEAFVRLIEGADPGPRVRADEVT